MQLKVPLIRQAKGSQDCGLACVAMVLGYYGERINIDELKKQLKVYKFGTYAPQLGEFLIKRGYKVAIQTAHPSLFTLRDANLSQPAIRKRFEELKKKAKPNHRNAVRHFCNFMDAGGRIEIGIPARTDIQKEVKHKRPLIALLTSGFLWSKDPRFNFHYNVITGTNAERIFVNDPERPNKGGGRRQYPEAAYLYSIYASAYGDLDNASLMKVSK